METKKRIWGMGNRSGVFKSYYVVWKLIEKPQALYRIFLFKSYYVVWKLHSETTPGTRYMRLNRTM